MSVGNVVVLSFAWHDIRPLTLVSLSILILFNRIDGRAPVVSLIFQGFVRSHIPLIHGLSLVLVSARLSRHFLLVCSEFGPSGACLQWVHLNNRFL